MASSLKRSSHPSKSPRSSSSASSYTNRSHRRSSSRSSLRTSHQPEPLAVLGPHRCLVGQVADQHVPEIFLSGDAPVEQDPLVLIVVQALVDAGEHLEVVGLTEPGWAVEQLVVAETQLVELGRAVTEEQGADGDHGAVEGQGLDAPEVDPDELQVGEDAEVDPGPGQATA